MNTQPTRPSAEHWTCRVALGSSFAYLISSTPPVVDPDTKEVTWTPIPGFGDDLAYIDWASVIGVMVRHIDAAPPEPDPHKDALSRGRKTQKANRKKGKAEPVAEPGRMTRARIREHILKRYPEATEEQVLFMVQSEAERLNVAD